MSLCASVCGCMCPCVTVRMTCLLGYLNSSFSCCYKVAGSGAAAGDKAQSWVVTGVTQVPSSCLQQEEPGEWETSLF